MNFDKRVTPARGDIAAAHLRGQVEAAHFAEGEVFGVRRGRAALRMAPSHDAALGSELLHGERFTVYAHDGGWAWGQYGEDGPVGYVPLSELRVP